ncbi:hypothetical protein [Actinotalea sp.]|uniref:hypothetical protein n=1 Tax=Actinotalea sp. TaxID=1872145 RepID=UPI00356A5BCD
MTLKFSERGHRYTLDGRPVPGVTTLLGKGLPKPALVYWSAKAVAEYVMDNPDGVEALRAMGRDPGVAALKQIPWQKRDEAAVRGTDVHGLAEQIIHGREVEVPEHLAGHVEGYTRWLDAFDVEPIITEVPVANRAHWWAGKPDAIVRLGGQTWLLDWKTSTGVYGETGLQTAAYARAEFYAPTPDDEQALPHIDRTGVVHITADGSYLYPLAGNPAEIDEAYGVFRHIAYVAQRTDWIKGLLGEPMPAPESEDAA